jgi:membrane protein implicated in regulation of membrane protease activity
MPMATWWWVLAGAAIALELVTGTFYLLMLALGFAAAAVAAWTGATLALQIVAAAAVGGGATAAWHGWRVRHRAVKPPAAADRDLHLDIGETLHINDWRADGTATVRYRGAAWTVVTRPGVAPTVGLHRVAEVTGNRLVVDKA